MDYNTRLQRFSISSSACLMNQLPRLHLWIPELFASKGGIQAYSAYFLTALQQILAPDQLEIFLKNDTIAHSSQHSASPIHGAGTFPAIMRTPLFAAQLLGYAIRQRPDLVITTHLNFTLAAHTLKRFTNIPYWTVAHGIEAWNINHPPLQTALHDADRILAVSHYTRDRLIQEQALDPAKVVVLPNTFDSDRFQIAEKPVHLLKRYHLQPDQPVILTLCRLASQERYKGYDQVLAALPVIRQVFPKIHYLIVGKGEDRSRLEHLISDLNLQDCVTLAGFVPDSELCDYYNLCDVFAMPSKREGFGIVYLEALACGKPVLGGNQDGAIDALCQGKLGALVNPDSISDIATTLTQILQKTYPNRLLYQPSLLRQYAIETYGFQAFQATLAQLLHEPPQLN
jgi:glycosyltransferase involved in cell wall biosynthesis